MRRKPYTARGLSRVPCFRCGKPSTQQWQICSLGNEYKGLCTDCDIALNRAVLKFMGIDGKRFNTYMYNYRKQLRSKE